MIFKKPKKRILDVKRAFYITPNMIRVTFCGPDIQGIKREHEGGNCKLILPSAGLPKSEFAQLLGQGQAFPVRTYTVRQVREAALEMDIDFVAHGDNGPASQWAMSAKEGRFLAFMGPSPAKVQTFYADWYILAADPSALPVVSVVLERLPNNAKGVAILEVTSDADKQVINAPDGVEIRWLIHSDPSTASRAQEQAMRALEWPDGRIQACVAGESEVIKGIRAFLMKEKCMNKNDAYISGYWKIGLKETQHQAQKKAALL